MGESTEVRTVVRFLVVLILLSGWAPKADTFCCETFDVVSRNRSWGTSSRLPMVPPEYWWFSSVSLVSER